MNEAFEIPVTYQGQGLSFPARLLVLGYIHKFQVDVKGQEVLFEPDEERNYRAVVDPEKQQTDSSNDVELLKTIAKAIEAIVK